MWTWIVNLVIDVSCGHTRLAIWIFNPNGLLSNFLFPKFLSTRNYLSTILKMHYPYF